MPSESPQDAVAAQLQWQADTCRQIGSELYAGLLERAVADVGELGPTWEILRGHEDDPQFSVLGLRLLGGVNRLVLTERAPDLAEAYRAGSAPAAWDCFHDVLRRPHLRLRRRLR